VVTEKRLYALHFRFRSACPQRGTTGRMQGSSRAAPGPRQVRVQAFEAVSASSALCDDMPVDSDTASGTGGGTGTGSLSVCLTFTQVPALWWCFWSTA
jgi:hypothetical protein